MNSKRGLGPSISSPTTEKKNPGTSNRVMFDWNGSTTRIKTGLESVNGGTLSHWHYYYIPVAIIINNIIYQIDFTWIGHETTVFDLISEHALISGHPPFFFLIFYYFQFFLNFLNNNNYFKWLSWRQYKFTIYRPDGHTCPDVEGPLIEAYRRAHHGWHYRILINTFLVRKSVKPWREKKMCSSPKWNICPCVPLSIFDL